MIEIWDAYDKQFNKIENMKLVRGELIPDGVYHLVCDIIVKHTDGTYLLMQRDFQKHCGGMWELTAGGSALADETPIECAIRELKEETGIISSDLQEIRRIVHDGHSSIYVEFLCITNWNKNDIVLQKGETIDYKWVEKNEILAMDADALASSRSLSIIKETEI
ncbi:MAG: NUDIX hydrolase [Oscillospiraceae bacterium]|nr:NUDIX hydrolase [Oscillospiraceae bacterium]